MTVRAKVVCTELGFHQNDDGTKVVRVRMSPAYNGPGYEGLVAPSGPVELIIWEGAAFEEFQVGQAYYLGFTPTS